MRSHSLEDLEKYFSLELAQNLKSFFAFVPPVKIKSRVINLHVLVVHVSTTITSCISSKELVQY